MNLNVKFGKHMARIELDSPLLRSLCPVSKENYIMDSICPRDARSIASVRHDLLTIQKVYILLIRMKISLRKTKNIQATPTLNFNFDLFFSIFSYLNEDKNTSNSVILNNVEKSMLKLRYNPKFSRSFSFFCYDLVLVLTIFTI
jgi:hypothetical protein